MTITGEELAGRLADPSLLVLDVRTAAEHAGTAGYPCDATQGHIPGSRHVEVDDIIGRSPEEIRALIGETEAAEIVCYCHSGQRSAIAVAALREAGYEARNYEGSWHEWSRRPAS